ncbi:MAG: glycoside hydrolase family 78 protein [Anaerolineales bacterium]|nr:glycoside hydrolase family 78 protein [Anaerolineales bacterium]
MGSTTVLHVRVEHFREVLGIGMTRPRLSWVVQTESQNWQQMAYELEAYDAQGQLNGQTGKVESDQSALVDWPFETLTSRERLAVRVRVWGNDGGISEWSEPVKIEVGLLETADWQAQFITPTWQEDTSKLNPAPYLRREFELRCGIASARLYVTALGVYEAEINGRLVSDHVLSPGWTVYDERLRYQTFDVTDLLHEGQNAIGAIVGDGWFRGRLGFGGGRPNHYGEQLALLAQLEVQYVNGSSETIVTDENWRAATGAILTSSIYDGESYDARLEHDGWTAVGFDDSNWHSVKGLEWNLKTLEAPIGPPVRRTETIAPIAITQSPSGKTLVDFGQNLVGRLVMTVQGEAGRTVTLRHAEVLENGELGIRPLRHAAQTNRYTLKGGGLETWEPRFTFQGFRYVEVSGWPGELKLADLTAVVLHSDMERTGWFECSDPMLNQLHQNVVWGMRGNFLDVPTDCPQRDERLGWTGDIQVFAPTASFLYDASSFLQSWLRDLAVEQRKGGGAVPHIVPNIMGRAGGAAAWGDAAAVVPWVLYQRFGDVGILADQFESMCAWVDHIASVASENHLWDKGFQFGDWLDPTSPPDNPGKARTDKTIVATAYFARSAQLVAQAAAVLGRTDAAHKYGALAAKVREAFAGEYVTPNGRMMNDAETAYALAITFNLLTDDQRQRAGNRLAELVRGSGYHIQTGFVGTPIMCDALCSTGHYDVAYRLLKQEECPSWLYPVTMGATTIWERWDSMLPDGSINPGEMTSFNHYALGAVADWMQRTIGGLVPVEPGYRRLAIAPRPGGGITQAQVRHLTPYGLAECQWQVADGQIHLQLVVPPNTTAVVTLPNTNQPPIEVGSGSWQWSAPYNDPDAQGVFTVDDLVGDILYDKQAREVVMTVLEQVSAPPFVKRILMNERNAPLSQMLGMLPQRETAVALINEGLACLSV